jgi:hypothetical protein
MLVPAIDPLGVIPATSQPSVLRSSIRANQSVAVRGAFSIAQAEAEPHRQLKSSIRSLNAAVTMILRTACPHFGQTNPAEMIRFLAMPTNGPNRTRSRRFDLLLISFQCLEADDEPEKEEGSERLISARGRARNDAPLANRILTAKSFFLFVRVVPSDQLAPDTRLFFLSRFGFQVPDRTPAPVS